MKVWMYVCTLWKGVPYHLWAKNVASGGPPPHLLEAQKTCGGGIFHVVRWNISQKFLALPPPNIPGLKGGDVFIIVYTLVMIWKSWDHPQLWDILGVVPSRSLLSEDMVLIRSTITATRMLKVPKFSLGANGAVAFSRGLMYVMNLLIIHIYIYDMTHTHTYV